MNLQFTHDLPLEIARLVAVRLPIDADLAAIAMASNTQFTRLILFDFAFAHTHLTTHLMTHALETITHDAWPLLPFTYKCAVYDHLITDLKYYNTRDLKCAVYPLSSKHSVRLAATLMSGSWAHFDLEQHAFQLMDCLCSNANAEALKLAVTHPNMVWTLATARLLFLHAIAGNKPEILEFLLTQTRLVPKFGAAAYLGPLIETATQFGHAALVKQLLSDGRSDPTINDGAPLRKACSSGNIEIVALLLLDSRVHPNPTSPSTKPAIVEAASRGHDAIVKLLLADARTDPSLPNWSALEQAVQDRRLGIVQILLKDDRVDPAANDCEVLHIACSSWNPDEELVSLLIADGRVDPNCRAGALLLTSISLGRPGIVDALMAGVRSDHVKAIKRQDSLL
ncbi:hypothetical protein HDU81_008371 [Chytriomyces hyalinus]|nr:hypothetical protein HDU81_008371 [Chytriomyces hyalinus]